MRFHDVKEHGLSHLQHLIVSNKPFACLPPHGKQIGVGIVHRDANKNERVSGSVQSLQTDLQIERRLVELYAPTEVVEGGPVGALLDLVQFDIHRHRVHDRKPLHPVNVRPMLLHFSSVRDSDMAIEQVSFVIGPWKPAGRQWVQKRDHAPLLTDAAALPLGVHVPRSLGRQRRPTAVCESQRVLMPHLIKLPPLGPNPRMLLRPLLEGLWARIVRVRVTAEGQAAHGSSPDTRLHDVRQRLHTYQRYGGERQRGPLDGPY